MKDEVRNNDHKKNQSLEYYLKILNDILQIGSREYLKTFSSTTEPVPIFIVGNPRSGTTLLFQYLAETNCFNYPSNLISRFYEAPGVGFLTQMLMLEKELDFKGEMSFSKNPSIYKSNIGKTEGLFAPNEFWYFWRRFFPIMEILPFNEDILSEENIILLKKELSFIQSLNNKPLLFKGLSFNWNIKYISEIFPKSKFIFIERDVESNARSIFQTRMKYFGNVLDWYSFKGPEYNFLHSLSPKEQVLGQVLLNNKAIEEQICNLDSDRYFKLTYNSFCKEPAKTVSDLFDKFQIEMDSSLDLDFSFDSSEKIDLEFDNDYDLTLEIVKSKIKNFELK